MSRFIALDLGAESGRAMIGVLEDSKLSLQEAYRFTNGPVRVFDSLYWDPLRLFAEMKQGLNAAARGMSQEHGRGFVSLGVDTWGVDYALLDGRDELAGNPHVYRDPRTTGVMERLLTWLPQWEIFEQSGGVQFMTINTLYQVRAMVEQKSPHLAAAATFLMIADLFNFWLTGRKAVEYTNATTTQFFDSRTRTWSLALLEKLGAPTHIFPEVVLPGEVLGMLLPDVASEVEMEPVPVVAVATHDTASAAMAVPSATDNVAWLSSGTWSLLGAVAEQAIVTPEAMRYNISSYGGVGGKVLPWKNIMGLWLVQECRRIWARHGESYSYADLTQMAAEARPFVAILDPDHAAFLAPADMPAAIQSYCQTTGQTIPESRGEIVRVALEGLALKYRLVIERLEALLQRRFEAVHIVGGGSQNRLLCQFTADVTRRPVVAGPVEATAIGNVAMQAVSSGHLASIEEARNVIRDSFTVEVYEPTAQPAGTSADAWDEAYGRFLSLAAP